MMDKTQRLSEIRRIRAGENVRRALGRILAQYRLRGRPGEEVSLTISEVKMTKDLKQAKVYVMSLGGQDIQVVLDQLNADVLSIQKMLAAEVSLRFRPRLTFYPDTGFDQAELLKNLMDKGKHNAPPHQD